MKKYNVDIDGKRYVISVDKITLSHERQKENILNTGEDFSYEASKLEYEHCMQRSEKLDNKIYIFLTICAFLFVLVTDTIKKIANFNLPKTNFQLVLIIIYSILLFTNIILYSYLLVTLTHLLKGIPVERFDPMVILERNMPASDSKRVARYICSKYNQCIKSNNENLEKRFDKFNHCVYFLIPIIFISFTLAFISNFIV